MSSQKRQERRHSSGTRLGHCLALVRTTCRPPRRRRMVGDMISDDGTGTEFTVETAGAAFREACHGRAGPDRRRVAEARLQRGLLA